MSDTPKGHPDSSFRYALAGMTKSNAANWGRDFMFRANLRHALSIEHIKGHVRMPTPIVAAASSSVTRGKVAPGHTSVEGWLNQWGSLRPIVSMSGFNISSWGIGGPR